MNQKDWFAQRAEREKEALYRAELENYSEKMVLDNNNRIIFINAKYAAEFGRGPQEMEGLFMDEIIPPDRAPAIVEIGDYASPYIPQEDRLRAEGYMPLFVRAPLTAEDGTVLGAIIYDGRDWLARYQALYGKLNELVDEYEYLHPSRGRDQNARFVGESPVVQELRRQIFQAAKINATLLIEGETGTGKEVLANEVFRASKRRDQPFVKLNCAALPQELIESELFGYEEGAFTGARRGGKEGLFASADGGVILLDEINSLSLPAQAKLLRVIQERVVTPVGGNRSTPIDVRVIAISNHPLEQMVEEGLFREDLYYRLNVLHIALPPLRERTEDIPLLVRLFVEKCNREMEKHVEKIDPEVYRYLKTCPWPGNVRQLQNWVERAMASVWKGTLNLSNFYWLNLTSGESPKVETVLMAREGVPLPRLMDELEAEIIKNTLSRHKGNKKQCAEALGISRQMLHRKIKQYGLT